MFHGAERIQTLEESVGSDFISLCASCVTQAKSLNLCGPQFPLQNGVYNTCHCIVWGKTETRVWIVPNKVTDT